MKSNFLHYFDMPTPFGHYTNDKKNTNHDNFNDIS